MLNPSKSALLRAAVANHEMEQCFHSGLLHSDAIPASTRRGLTLRMHPVLLATRDRRDT